MVLLLPFTEFSEREIPKACSLRSLMNWIGTTISDKNKKYEYGKLEKQVVECKKLNGFKDGRKI
jgi:hypothetical protein